MTKNHTFSNWTRRALIIVPAVAIVVGAYSLIRSIPLDYHPYFWDGGNLLNDVSRDTFISEGGGSGYALRKFGYTAPVHYAVRWRGLSGVLLVNLFWYAVILGTGAIVFLRRRQRVGALVFLSGMICLPFVHKYIGMGNPTMQAMALWFLFFLVSERRNGPVMQTTVVPGVLFAGLVLTDFPKWALVAVPAVLVVEFLHPVLLGNPLRRDTLILGVKRSLCIFAWGTVGVIIAALINSDYLHNNIAQVMNVDSATIEGIRFGVSWNYVLQLWVLGGFWTMVFVLVFWQYAAPAELRRQPGVAMAVTVVAVFSLILWPRSARMFAVTVPFLLFVFSSMVDGLSRRPFEGRRTMMTQLSALVVLFVFAVRAPNAGACFQLPTGVREVKSYIASDSRIPPYSSVCTYMQPVFATGESTGYTWLYLGSVSSTDLDWVVTGDFIDDVVIDEQLYNGAKPLDWRRTRMKILDVLLEQPVMAEFPCDFYTSKWYMMESNFDDGHLAFMLRRAAEMKSPKWRVRYIGNLFGRPLP